jgi:predicted neuraminidase
MTRAAGPRTTLLLAAAALAGLVAVAIPMLTRDPWPVAFTAPPPVPLSDGVPIVEHRIIIDAGDTDVVHAASAIALEDGRLRAFWWQGTAEAAADVQIMTSVFDGTGWSTPSVAISAPALSAELGRYVSKLGNMVPVRRPDGSLWLIHVGVWAFGWVDSSLVIERSTDEGETWTPLRKPVTTPFLNRATLVKGPPVAIDDPDLLALPAYQEMYSLMPELLLFDDDGRVVGKSRMTAGRVAIQPIVVPEDSTHAIALARSQVRGTDLALRFETFDGGRSWSGPVQTNVHNEGEPVPAIRLENGRLVMVTMDGPQRERRIPKPLRILISDDDGLTWRSVYSFFKDDGRAEQSYAWFMVGPDGFFHILFSEERQVQIGDIRFNRAWLDARIRESEVAALPDDAAPAP